VSRSVLPRTSGPWAVFTAAAVLLTGCGEPDEVARQARLLTRGEVAERVAAAAALAGVDDPRAVEALTRGLSDPIDQVRIASAEALAATAPPDAIPALAASLKEDDNWRVRRAAAAALSNIATPATADPLAGALFDEQPVVRDAAAVGLAKLGGEVLPRLVEAASHPDPSLRAAAVTALGGLASRGVEGAEPPIVAAVADTDTGVQLAAARGLGSATGRDAREALITLVEDPDTPATARKAAIESLGQHRAPAAVETLSAILGGRRTADAVLAARALGAMGGTDAASALVPGLQSRDRETREAAVAALRAIGDDAATTAVRLLRDERTGNDAAAAAAAMLGHLDHPDADATLLDALASATHSAVADAAAASLVQRGYTDAAPRLIGLLDAGSAATRNAAIVALGRFEVDAAVTKLVELLDNRLGKESKRDHDTTLRAVVALGAIGGPDAAPAVASVLSGNHAWRTRQAAVSVLGRLGDPRGLDALIRHSNRDPFPKDAQLRENMARAVGSIPDPRSATLLIRLLNDDIADVRRAAARGLLRQRPEDAVPPLVEQLSGRDANRRGAAAQVLAAIGEPAVTPLLTALPYAGDDARPQVIRALAETGDPRAAAPLLAIAENTAEPEAARFAAVWGLAHLAARDAVPRLTALADDPAAPAGLRDAAAAAVQRIKNPPTTGN